MNCAAPGGEEEKEKEKKEEEEEEECCCSWHFRQWHSYVTHTLPRHAHPATHTLLPRYYGSIARGYPPLSLSPQSTSAGSHTLAST